jgi:hypothetical protein
MANYLVVTYRDRLQAEAGYTAAENAGIPLAQLRLFGKGYKTLEESPVFDPTQAAWRQVRMMMLWLVPFGFFAGFTFNQVTALTISPSLGAVGNGILGGLMGAGSGALGSLAVGGGIQLITFGQERVLFRQRLQAGKYLLVITGSETTIRQANRALRSLPSELLQIYESPEPVAT